MDEQAKYTNSRAKNLRFTFIWWVFEICIWPKKSRTNNNFHIGEVYIYYSNNRTRNNIRYMVQVVERGEEWFKCVMIKPHFPIGEEPELTFRTWDTKSWNRQKDNFEFITYANPIRNINQEV